MDTSIMAMVPMTSAQIKQVEIFKKSGEIPPCQKGGFQTVDKAPGLRRGFSSVVINIPIIFPLFIKKNSLYQLEN